MCLIAICKGSKGGKQAGVPAGVSQDIVALPPESQKSSSHIPQTGVQAAGGTSRMGGGSYKVGYA